jgi:hypothetical protein
MGGPARRDGVNETALPGPDTPDEPIPACQVISALERVLASQVFAGTPVLRRLLQFVVERTLEHNQNQLKEYALGVDVFDRGPGFDPRPANKVRVGARPLRRPLADN